MRNTNVVAPLHRRFALLVLAVLLFVALPVSLAWGAPPPRAAKAPAASVPKALAKGAPKAPAKEPTKEDKAAAFLRLLSLFKTTPGDLTLREKVIRAALDVTPPPAIPAEAQRHFDKAVALEKDGGELCDYALAAREYESALFQAPWWREAYLSHATALSRTGNAADAGKAQGALRLFLLAAPNPDDARLAKEKSKNLDATAALLKQAEELRKKPGDTALRLQIVKAGAAMTPSAWIPAEARQALLRGNALLKAGRDGDDYSKAAAEYEKALSVAPWWADAYHDLALALAFGDRYADAIEALKTYLLSAPAEADARDAEERIASLQATTELLALFEKMKVDASANPQVTVEKLIRQAAGLKVKPWIPMDARRRYAEALEIMKSAKSPEDYERAGGVLMAILERAPWWPELYQALAEALSRTGRLSDLMAAATVLKLYLSSEPAPDLRDNAQQRLLWCEAVVNLATDVMALELEPGNQELREKIIAAAAEIMPPPPVPDEALRCLKAADALFGEARDGEGYTLAVLEYEKALSLAPWLPAAWYNYSLALSMTGQEGDTERALTAMRLYLLSKPAPEQARQAEERVESLESTLVLAQNLEALKGNPGDLQLRESILRAAAAIKPPPSIPEEARRYFVRANALQREARDAAGFALAVAEYEKALSLAPWWPEAYYNYALALAKAGRHDDAVAQMRLYLTTNPADAREAQDRIYGFEAEKELYAKRKEQDDAARREEDARRQQEERRLREAEEAARREEQAARRLEEERLLSEKKQRAKEHPIEVVSFKVVNDQGVETEDFYKNDGGVNVDLRLRNVNVWEGHAHELKVTWNHQAMGSWNTAGGKFFVSPGEDISSYKYPSKCDPNGYWGFTFSRGYGADVVEVTATLDGKVIAAKSVRVHFAGK